MKAVYFAFYALCLAGVCSCHPESEKAPDGSKIGQYVYLDDNAIIHVKENCIRLRHGNDDNGHKIYGKEFIDTLDFSEYKLYYSPRYCSHCVSTEVYQHLLRISERNKPNVKNLSE